MTAHTRRAFLRGRFDETPVMRPYGALSEADFREACTGCDACTNACPEAIIIRGEGGLPVIDPSLGACTFCNVCIEVCEPGALQSEQPWLWRASADSSCLAQNGVFCRTCEDHCDEGAIRFRLATGGRSTPNIDPDLCVGCGACASACPAGAVRFTQIPQTTETRPC